MKRCLLFILAVYTFNYTNGQSTFRKNDIYLEAGGNGLFGSVNYERQLTAKPGLGVRFGVGFYTINASYLTIPVGINYLFPLKNKKSFIDAGFGVTWTRSEETFIGNNKHFKGDAIVNFIPSIAYRRHTNKNVMWRISYISVANKDVVVPWIGISVGKRF